MKLRREKLMLIQGSIQMLYKFCSSFILNIKKLQAEVNAGIEDVGGVEV